MVQQIRPVVQIQKMIVFVHIQEWLKPFSFQYVDRPTQNALLGITISIGLLWYSSKKTILFDRFTYPVHWVSSQSCSDFLASCAPCPTSCLERPVLSPLLTSNRVTPALWRQRNCPGNFLISSVMASMTRHWPVPVTSWRQVRRRFFFFFRSLEFSLC